MKYVVKSMRRCDGGVYVLLLCCCFNYMYLLVFEGVPRAKKKNERIECLRSPNVTINVLVAVGYPEAKLNQICQNRRSIHAKIGNLTNIESVSSG